MERLIEQFDRIWRSELRTQLIVLFVLLMVSNIPKLGGMRSGQTLVQALPLVALFAFWTWRVSKGGVLSRAFLMLGGFGAYGSAVFSIAMTWSFLLIPRMLAGLAILAILTSPAVLRRFARPGDRPFTLPARPPWWLVAVGLVGGAIIAAAFLAHPVVAPAPAWSTERWWHGYPLPVIAPHHYPGPHLRIGHLFRNFAQWSVVAFSVGYLGWRWFGPRVPLEPSTSLQELAAPA